MPKILRHKKRCKFVICILADLQSDKRFRQLVFNEKCDRIKCIFPIFFENTSISAQLDFCRKEDNRIKNRDKENAITYKESYSLEKWQETNQDNHSLQDCKACYLNSGNLYFL